MVGCYGSGMQVRALGMRSKTTCRFGQVANFCVECVREGLGQLDVLALQATGLGAGRALTVVSFFQFAMSFCHDDSIQGICEPAARPPG